MNTAMKDRGVNLFVCTSCRQSIPNGEGFTRPGGRLAEALAERLSDDADITVTPVECLAVCNRPSTIALVCDQKWTYLIGNIDNEAHLDQIVESARAYRLSETGIIPWKERPEAFRKGVVARVPPLGFTKSEQDPK